MRVPHDVLDFSRCDITKPPSDDVTVSPCTVARTLDISARRLRYSRHDSTDSEDLCEMDFFWHICDKALESTHAEIDDDRTGALNLAPRTLPVFTEGARQYNREVLAAHARAVASDNDGIPRAPPRLRPPRKQPCHCDTGSTVLEGTVLFE